MTILGRASAFALSAIVFGVLADGAQAQRDLPEISCAEEGHLRSLDSNNATVVTFVNRSPVTIRTYWLNFTGKRVFYAEVQPGRSYTQQTYVTHPWVITSSGAGDCVAIYQPALFPGTVVFR